MTQPPAPARLSAADWYASLPKPVLQTAPAGEGRLDMRRYAGSPARMDQPALTENLLSLHLGGPKRVRRWTGGRMSVHDVELGAMTIMPALQPNRWLTVGPVDFGLITLSPALLRQTCVEEFDREPDRCELSGRVGVQHPEMERLFRALLGASDRSGPAGRLYPESLLVVLTVALLRDHSALPAGEAAKALLCKGGLAEWRLRRVVDHMMDNMAGEIGLSELTALTGLSRAQFFRAFKQSTGQSPHRYLAGLRLDKALALLSGAPLSIGEVAAAVGLGPELRFNALFRKRFGVSPRFYRSPK